MKVVLKGQRAKVVKNIKRVIECIELNFNPLVVYVANDINIRELNEDKILPFLKNELRDVKGYFLYRAYNLYINDNFIEYHYKNNCRTMQTANGVFNMKIKILFNSNYYNFLLNRALIKRNKRISERILKSANEVKQNDEVMKWKL